MLTGIRRLWQRIEDWMNTPKKPAPEYTTRFIAMRGDSWIAELCRDGVPYQRMQVHSISKLLRRYE